MQATAHAPLRPDEATEFADHGAALVAPPRGVGKVAAVGSVVAAPAPATVWPEVDVRVGSDGVADRDGRDVAAGVAEPDGTVRPDAALEPAPAVALLAATALGLAFTTGLTRGSVTLLGDLADAQPARLLQASEHALQMGSTSWEPRRLAADLLERAALFCEQRTGTRP